MYRKSLMMTLFAAALLMAGSAAVSAQTFIIRGRVEIRDANGAVTPVAGAAIDGYRTDIKAKTAPATTNKKGEYTIAGLQAGGVYILVVSAPGAAPDVLPGVRSSGKTDDLNFTLNAGDGRRLTQEEALAMAKGGSGPATGAGVGVGVGNVSGGDPKKKTPEQIKADEEFEKKKKEVEAKNARVQNADKIIASSWKEGTEALKAKNYDVAIAKSDEGIAADPEFVHSVATFMSIKSEALRSRGYEKHAASVAAAKGGPLDKGPAKADVTAAYDVAKASWEMMEKAPVPTDAKDADNYKLDKYNSLANMSSALVTLAMNELDRDRAEDAKKVFPSYLALITVPEKKDAAQRQFADVLRKSNDCEDAAAQYQILLDTKPQDVDALAGKGLCLVNNGAIKELDDNAAAKRQGSEMIQEGLNVLQAFVDVAPDTHPLKKDSLGTIEYYKTEKKIVPQKGKGVVKKKN